MVMFPDKSAENAGSPFCATKTIGKRLKMSVLMPVLAPARCVGASGGGKGELRQVPEKGSGTAQNERSETLSVPGALQGIQGAKKGS